MEKKLLNDNPVFLKKMLATEASVKILRKIRKQYYKF